ncbi:MAG: tRNA (N(6)-L-threonylcarbamoyladenosine(37)-C(2))-methylthiotransferase MtaB [Anaerolineaceae bacterium]|nr:tRNA (N(6)-L-threonylcarbamoyladenosine(37)-C(2))-methylthiotransferase MtaB [Anaerolineaceae bacterium]
MKVYLDSIGCRLNQSEIEKMGQQFRLAGHDLVDDPGQADLVVVNTCTVTAKAAADSRGKVRRAHRAGNEQIIVTGCWASVDENGALELPGVASVVVNEQKDALVQEALHLPAEMFDRLTDLDEPVLREPLPGAHMRTRAFLKAQDGCDNHCTYCVTRIARGKARSASLETVMNDVRGAEIGGAREIVLTGVHLASWGQDFDPPLHVRDLVEHVLNQSKVPRLRLSSLEPWDLNEAFFTLWQNPRLCRHLHLPLQSGSERTLRRMARKITPDEFTALMTQARAAAPEMAVTTDVIVGFPGETEEDFEESLAFVERMNFAGGHVFTYSARPGTPAAKYPGQLTNAVKKERSARMRAVLDEASRRYHERFIGRAMDVLWESAKALEGGGWELSGLTDNYLRVVAHSDVKKWNEIEPVRLLEIEGDGLRGESQ